MRRLFDVLPFSTSPLSKSRKMADASELLERGWNAHANGAARAGHPQIIAE